MTTKTASNLCIAIKQAWAEKYGDNTLSGNCFTIATILSKKLKKAEIPHKLISGWFIIDDTTKWSHTWVEVDILILDPSVSMFGDYPQVAKIPNKQYVKRTIISSN